MRVDFHCHTKKVKSGEVATRNVTPELFAEKVRNADVKIVAITNHNVFDTTQYNELATAAGDDCQVWPGIELNINGSNGKQWHLIVVSNPETVSDFYDIVSKLTHGVSPEDCYLDIENVVSGLSSIECFYLPHYHKSPEISEEDSKKLLELVGESFKILNETSDIRSMGVFANHNTRVIVGSDVKDWNDYEESSFSELRLPVESFHQLYMLAKRDPQVVTSLLDKNDSRSLTINFAEKVKLDLKLYKEVNVVFGPKGTGKSEILKAVQETFEKQGYSCCVYRGSEKDSQFNQLLSADDMMRHVGKVNALSCEDHFQAIKDWEDKSPTPIQDYVQWINTKDINANKQRMKITLASTYQQEDGQEFEQVKEDIKNIRRAIRVFNRVDATKYLTSADSKQLDTLLARLEDLIANKYRDELINVYASQFSNWSIEIIKRLTDKKTNTVSRPGTTGFSPFAANRIKLHRSVQSILNNINGKEVRERKSIGSLESKGNVYIQSRYRMCCSESRSGEFGDKKVTDIKNALKLLGGVKENYCSEDIYHQVSTLSDELETTGVNSTEQFLGLSKEVILSNGEEYKPSNGEKSILMMQKVLGEDKDVYIFDEPELGMGNSYIDKNIRPKISNLGKSNKTVVIATHNANIAVRTLPYATIFRDHDNGVYKTYIGNPFINSLINIRDDNDVISWKETSMTVLEGGVEAFYERKDIYESRNN